MSVASGAYFAGPMQPNNNRKYCLLKKKDLADDRAAYVWGNRSFQLMQPQFGNMNQHFPPSQHYPPSGFPVGYNSQPGGSLPSYPQDPSQPPSYLAAAPGVAPRQNQGRR